MAKLPGRIPANTVKASAPWMPPELGKSQGSQTIRLWSAEKNRKLPQNRLVGNGASRPANQASSGELSEFPELERRAEVAAEVTAAAHDDEHISAALTDTQAQSQIDDPESSEFANQDPANTPNSSVDETAGAMAAEQSTDLTSAEPEIDLNDQGYKDGLAKGEAEGYEAGQKAGYEAGLIAGRQAGELAVKDEFDKEVAGKRQVIGELLQVFSSPPSVDAAVETSLTDLITQLTKAVVMGEVSTDRTHIQHLVSVALSALPSNTGIPRIFVNPSDTSWVETQLLSDAEIVPDGSLARGGCRIETKESLIDASISDRIRAALRQSLAQEIGESSERELQQYEPDASAQMTVDKNSDE